MSVPDWVVGLAMVVWMPICPGTVLSQSGTMTVRMRDCTVTSLAFASVTSRWYVSIPSDCINLGISGYLVLSLEINVEV